MAFKMKGPTFFKSPFKEIKKKKVKTLPVSQEGRDIDESNREESRGEVFSWNPGQQKRLTEKEDKAAFTKEQEKKYMKKRKMPS